MRTTLFVVCVAAAVFLAMAGILPNGQEHHVPGNHDDISDAGLHIYISHVEHFLHYRLQLCLRQWCLQADYTAT